MGNSLDRKVLHKLSYGLYVVTTAFAGRMNGQIADAIMQVNAQPEQTVAVSLNNDNFTCELVKQSGKLAISVLSTAYDKEVIANFGFNSGRDMDKFAAFPPKISENGLPYYEGPGFCGWLEGSVIEQLTVGSHTIFVVRAEAGTVGAEAAGPLIYADYLQAKRQPAAAPKPEPETTPEPKRKGYRCDVCGYIEYGEIGPDYRCPICGVGPEHFVEI